MSEQAPPTVPPTAEVLMGWAAIVGVRLTAERLPAVFAYLDEIRVADETLALLELDDADDPAAFDPSWGQDDR